MASGDKVYALSLFSYPIPPDKPVHVYGTAQEKAFFADWTL